jgi:NADH dehydrogenase
LQAERTSSIVITMGDKTPKKRVVVVGGGFGGMNAAKALGKASKGRLDITVVDRRNHHLFQPLLYQVATAGLSPADISSPIRKVLRGVPSVQVHLAEVTRVDLEARQVITSRQTLDYDYLVLACGATHSYFGNDQWEKHAPGLKTLEQAVEIRRRVLRAFEEAELETDKVRQRNLMTFVVVGGGPTGVELAGALGEISRFTLCEDFRNVDPTRTRILLIQGGKRILPAYAPELSEAATRKLEELGVTVWTSTRVTDIDEDGVWMGDERLEAKTVLWAAGVRASSLNEDLEVELDRAGRVTVEPDLSIAGHPEVFVIGDQSRFVQEDGSDVPGLAPAAIQQGQTAAENIIADLNGKPRTTYRYIDKGMMATIGRAAAIAQIGSLRFRGFFAWATWCFIHILYLIGFRNKVLVLIQWIWSYVRFGRGARLITEKDWRLRRPEKLESED